MMELWSKELVEPFLPRNMEFESHLQLLIQSLKRTGPRMVTDKPVSVSFIPTHCFLSFLSRNFVFPSFLALRLYLSLSLAHILTHAHTHAHTHPQTQAHTHKPNLSLSPYSTFRFPITASISNLSYFVYLSTYLTFCLSLSCIVSVTLWLTISLSLCHAHFHYLFSIKPINYSRVFSLLV